MLLSNELTREEVTSKLTRLTVPNTIEISAPPTGVFIVERTLKMTVGYFSRRSAAAREEPPAPIFVDPHFIKFGRANNGMDADVVFL